jgi:hypothetical protein
MYVNKTKRHLLLSAGASREIGEILVDLLDFLITFKLVSGINVSCGLLYKL